MKKRTTAWTCALALSLGLGAFSSAVSAQTIRASKTYVTEKKSVGNIHSVSADSSIDIVYYQTKGKPYVEIYTSDNLQPYIELKERDGDLCVRYQSGTRIMGENHSRVTVYAPSVSNFRTRASGDISVPRGLVTQGDVVMRTQGSGDISCGDIRCNGLRLEIDASGDVEAGDVSCRRLDAAVNASGDMEVSGMDCENADVSLNASGDCSLYRLDCTGEARIEANGSGDVDIKGKASKAVFRLNGSGDVDAHGFSVSEADVEVYGSGDLHCRAEKTLRAKQEGAGSVRYAGNPSQVEVRGKDISRD